MHPEMVHNVSDPAKHIPGPSCPERANGDFSEGDPPLPIPNREVKPLSADGTTSQGWESRSLPTHLIEPAEKSVGSFF